MKLLKINILFCLILLSCDKKEQEVTIISIDEIIIPSIEKNKLDANFKLKNGMLLFNEKPIQVV